MSNWMNFHLLLHRMCHTSVLFCICSGKMIQLCIFSTNFAFIIAVQPSKNLMPNNANSRCDANRGARLRTKEKEREREREMIYEQREKLHKSLGARMSAEASRCGILVSLVSLHLRLCGVSMCLISMHIVRATRVKRLSKCRCFRCGHDECEQNLRHTRCDNYPDTGCALLVGVVLIYYYQWNAAHSIHQFSRSLSPYTK